MHTLAAGLLWLAVGTPGAEAQPDPTVGHAIRAEEPVSPLAQPHLSGPIRRSLEAVRTSLSMLATAACADTAAKTGPRGMASTERQDACLTTTQTTPNTPTGTLYSPTFYFLVALLAVAIGWLLSKI